MTTVYLDRVFVLNTLVDYLLLLTTARLAGAPLRRLRLLVCAVGGGLYAAAVFLPGFQVLAQPVCRIGIGVLLGLVSFLPERETWRLTVLFLLLSGALAGLLLGMGLAAGSPGRYLGRVYRAEINWILLLGSVTLFYFMLGTIFRRSVRHEGGDMLQITICVGERQRKILALHDTGNTLCDPVSGQPVLVIEQEAVKDLFPPYISHILLEKLTPEEKMVRLHRQNAGTAFCLLPYRSVGVSAGLLLAFRSNRIVVGERVHRRTLVALTEGPVSDGGAYHALWGGEEGGQLHGEYFPQDTAMAQGVERAG